MGHFTRVPLLLVSLFKPALSHKSLLALRVMSLLHGVNSDLGVISVAQGVFHNSNIIVT